MHIETFWMERWQSLHEHQVEVNLSDSGILPLSLRELVQDAAELDSLLDARLIYSQTNGTPELRRAIAALYPGATEAHVEVTSGGSEANYLATWTLVEPGDEVVVMQPNYQQIQGLLPGLGAKLVPWTLRPDLDAGTWHVDLEELASLVTPKTRLIAICNPNNPTGRCLTEAELDAIARIAEQHGAWVLSDEVYRGSELAPPAPAPARAPETPSMWGRSERAIVTMSLSKSYGLPGVRLGWILSTPEFVDDCWKRHDYTTVAPNSLSDQVAQIALRPAVRERVLARTRGLLTENYTVVQSWLAERSEHVQTIDPEAGAIAWFRYSTPIESAELAERLRVEQSVLVVPGEQFGLESWLRIGFGGETGELTEGLGRLDALLGS